MEKGKRWYACWRESGKTARLGIIVEWLNGEMLNIGFHASSAISGIQPFNHLTIEPFPVGFFRMPSAKKDPPIGDNIALELQVLQRQLEDLQSQVTMLTTELDATKTEAAKMKDLAARSQADLQNAKARVERERSELAAFALEAMLKKLLPTIDSFQRAFQHLPEDLKNHEWVKGVIAIESQFLRELESAGLKRMSSLGSKIDPARHEVLQQGPGEKDTVTEVFEEGYEMHGRVLRPTKVKAGTGEIEN